MCSRGTPRRRALAVSADRTPLAAAIMSPPSFIDSPFTSKVEYEAWASLPQMEKVTALHLLLLQQRQS